MTSSSDTFPFGIADVVDLLGITVRRRLPSSMYLNCPFCGDQRGRLNVNTDKNVWRCNRCGAAGGMLALYARYNCTGNADAYREICEALGRYTPRPRVNDCTRISLDGALALRSQLRTVYTDTLNFSASSACVLSLSPRIAARRSPIISITPFIIVQDAGCPQMLIDYAIRQDSG